MTPSADYLRAHVATEDMADVMAAETLVAFTAQPRVAASRGGRHVELGLARGAGKPVIIVRPRENVFCWLPQVEHHDRWTGFLASIVGRWVRAARGEA